MSYGFDMGFAQANSLQEAMAIALEYTQFQMTEKNIRKTIRDNLYYIPSVRTGYIADEESKNRRADTLADTADRLAEIKSLNSTIKELEKKIDTLEDWKPSIKYGTHYCDTFYRNLSAACERNGKNLFAVQSDAEVFIAARFGFNASKLIIIPDVETYESNRHGTVRLAKAETRKPLYVSESFNYARFDVLCQGGHMQWELVDGKLCDYESPNI